MALSRAAEYTKKLDELVRQAKAPSAETAKRIKSMLEDLDREIIADIARTDPANYTSARLKMLRESIDRSLHEFGQQATSEINKAQLQSYTQTAAGIDSLVSSATGGVMVHPIIDRAALTVAQGYTADLVSGLTHEASTKLNGAVQRSYMGKTDLSTLIKQVGGFYGNKTSSGLFGSIGNKAMDISTNEIMRMHSMASAARIEDLSTRHPELGKQWKHLPAAHIPRLTHLMADGQVRKPDEPFNVGGEDLMYPRDPAGSAGNTINCHCIQLPHFPLSYLKQTLAR